MNAKALSLLILLIALSGCTYNAKIQDESLAGSTPPAPSSAQGITLINNHDALQVSSFKVGGYTGNVDARDAFINGAKQMLGSLYGRVDLASSPKPENPVYAVANFETTLPDPGPVTTLIVNDVRVDLYETASKKLLHSFTAKKEGRASVNPALGFFTGFTLFVFSPITIPAQTSLFGDQGKSIIENNLKSGLYVIRSEMAAKK
jgi:hypothetical protein